MTNRVRSLAHSQNAGRICKTQRCGKVVTLPYRDSDNEEQLENMPLKGLFTGYQWGEAAGLHRGFARDAANNGPSAQWPSWPLQSG